MYKSREDEYQRRFDETQPQSPYGYNNTQTPYHNDVYDEDDFYGQIMRNASRANPYREAPQETQQPFRQNAYENNYQEPPRRTRSDLTERLPRVEEPAYGRNTFVDNNNYTPTNNYLDTSYKQPEYSQPVRAYEHTSQYSTSQFQQGPGEEYQSTTSYANNPGRETLSRRARVQEESYVPREPQINSYPIEETTSLRRSRVVEEPAIQSYGSFQEAVLEEPKKTPIPMTLSEEVESSRKKSKPMKKQKNRQVEQVVEAGVHKKFVKANLLILLIGIINMAAVSLITASLLYTQFLKGYIVQPSMSNDMIKLCLLLTPIFAYQLAGLHCGYTMMKDKFKSLKPAFRILLSPILFIIYEIVGFVCEIPYLIYALVKMNDEA